MNFKPYNYFKLLVAFVGLFLVSCNSTKNIAYFQDINDSVSSQRKFVMSNFKEPIIKADDMLQITILTREPSHSLVSDQATSLVKGETETNALQSAPSNVFLVDRNGFLELPIIGKIKVGGLTTSEARDSIHNKVEFFYRQPVVSVRFANFNITVLGEVARPSTYTFPNEKVSVLDALGIAGDLTIYGKRNNVLLIRDSSGNKQFVRFNLNSSQMINSPYFYLKQGDVIYIEPNKSKIASTDAIKTRNYALLASVISVVIVLLTRL